MNRPPDRPSQDCVEHWLHAKFQSAGREYLQQLPPRIRVASRRVQRAEAPTFFPVPLRWAVAILALLAVGLWWTGRPPSGVVAQRTSPVQPAGPVQQLLAVQAAGPPTAARARSSKRPAPSIATTPSNLPAATAGSGEIPNVPVLATAITRQPEWRRAVNQPSNSPVRIVTSCGGSHGSGILPTARDAGGAGDDGSPVGGVLSPDHTPAAIIQPTETGLALWATDLSPSTEYTVWVQRRGALTPTQVGFDVSDASGTLAMNLPATVLPSPVSASAGSPLGLPGSALAATDMVKYSGSPWLIRLPGSMLAVTDMGVVMSGPRGVGSLVLDVATVFVLDETTGEIVLQTKLP